MSLPAAGNDNRSLRAPAPGYVELISTSNFSFLHGGSHPEELALTAVALGLGGFGLSDRNSFAGVVRAYVALRDGTPRPPPGFRFLVGTRLSFADGAPDIVAYPSDRAAYGRLCKLLSDANRRGEKGAPKLLIDDLLRGFSHNVVPIDAEDFTIGQLFIVIVDETDWTHSEAVLAALAARAPGRVWVAATCRFAGDDRGRLNRLAALARRHGAPLIASSDVLYHEPGRRVLQDVIACIRTHRTIADAGRWLEPNAERHLKAPGEMVRLFREHPEALTETQRLAARIDFSLDQLKYNYPTEAIAEETTQARLERLTWEGAARRYKDGISEKMKRDLWAELCLIAYKGYAPYFLTVHDIVQHARTNLRILCQGRGSAANSAVCFCLGITEVDPTRVDLVFGRFLSTERDEPPDIDVDFEHERREEVMQYVYEKYGGNHTGLTANVITYRAKSALREVAKVFGLSTDTIDAINRLHWGWGATATSRELAALGLDPEEPTLGMVLECARTLNGFPRHLSQHVGGFVITRDALDRLVPIGRTAMESRTIIEWNKDDIDALGILKVDILALGMLSCLRRAFDLLRINYGLAPQMTDFLAEVHDTPAAAAPVYEMTHRADTIGVFQIESRAQMSMLPRLKPKKFYDFIIEVAIVRPGPIQGGMVHPYLKRRLGEELVSYPSEALRAVLERTLGVPLFQEQAMQIAIVGAGFSAGEADRLRRSMATFKRTGGVGAFREKFVGGMLARGYPGAFAESCFKQIEGFGSYGFPESHAASFALLVYVSCWLKCHYPDVFTAALLNSQPMGFYAPAQIIRDAEEHGVEVRPVDINRSDFEAVLEAGPRAGPRVWPRHAALRPHIRSDKAIRLGFAAISGFKAEHAGVLMARRGAGYSSVRDLWLRTDLPLAALEKLAEADAFRSIGLDRRRALWAVRGLSGTSGAETLPLFAEAGVPPGGAEADPELPVLRGSEAVVSDYRTMSFSLKAHPVSFLRRQLDARRILACAALGRCRNGERVEVAGLVLVRQRPGTATGVVFATLEDETGIANAVIWKNVFDRHRPTIVGARLLAVRGKVQIEGLVVHVIAEGFTDMTADLVALAGGGDALAVRQAHAALPQGRNFK